MLDSKQINWKSEIASRVGDIEPAILEELAQDLEARFAELGSYDAVMDEWSANDLRAELGRIRQRRESFALGEVVSFNRVSDGYFRALGTPLLAGESSR